HLAIGADEEVRLAVRQAPHREAILPSGLEVHFRVGRRRAGRTPPPLDLFGVRPCAEHPLPRRRIRPPQRERGLRDLLADRLGRSHLPTSSFSGDRSRSVSSRYLASESSCPSQNFRYRSSHSAACLRGEATSWHRRTRPSFSLTRRPARSSTFRCFVTAGSETSNGSASSVTFTSPLARRARIARRVGSESAENVASRAA